GRAHATMAKRLRRSSCFRLLDPDSVNSHSDPSCDGSGSASFAATSVPRGLQRAVLPRNLGCRAAPVVMAVVAVSVHCRVGPWRGPLSSLRVQPRYRFGCLG